MARVDLTFEPRPERNGDKYFAAMRGGRCIGVIRDCHGNGDFHAVRFDKSRYFGSMRAAGAWLARLADKGK